MTIDRDYILLNGPMERSSVLDFMQLVSDEQKSDKATLFLTTNGGDPDAAFKIARHLQEKYEGLTVCLGGICKSAGTLLATAAKELAFSPYGELGPLDIQLSKRDDLGGMESGLNTTEAFYSLEEKARSTYGKLIMDILKNSGGVISFQTASHAVGEVVSGLYGPIYAQIDPDEVGSRARAMRIGDEYALRLNQKWDNLVPGGIDYLCQFYPSHGFVIDQAEASRLFSRVRSVNDLEMKLIDSLSDLARHQRETVEMAFLNSVVSNLKEGEQDAQLDESEAEQGSPDQDVTGEAQASA